MFEIDDEPPRHGYHPFRPGDRIECIESAPGGPFVGHTYTVDRAFFHEGYQYHHVTLVELQDTSYAVKRFKKV